MLTYHAKHPALVPGNHPFTKLFIIHEHRRHFHAGPQATLAAVRQQLWPCSGRDLVRRILKKCVTCARSRSKLSSTLMGDLPKHRIEVPLRPFRRGLRWTLI